MSDHVVFMMSDGGDGGDAADRERDTADDRDDDVLELRERVAHLELTVERLRGYIAEDWARTLEREAAGDEL